MNTHENVLRPLLLIRPFSCFISKDASTGHYVKLLALFLLDARTPEPYITPKAPLLTLTFTPPTSQLTTNH